MYDVLQDIRATLAAYLNDPTLGLPAVMPSASVQVLDDFPSPQQDLSERAVSVWVPDALTEVRYWSPQVMTLTEDAPGAVTGVVRYSFGRFKAQVQLDVWAKYAATRSDIVKALNTVLHRHPQVTLPGGDGYARPSRWHELSRLATSLPGGLFVYRFNDLPALQDDGAAVQGGEFRALFTGQVYGVLTTEEAAGVLRTIGLNMTITDGSGTASETVNV